VTDVKERVDSFVEELKTERAQIVETRKGMLESLKGMERSLETIDRFLAALREPPVDKPRPVRRRKRRVSHGQTVPRVLEAMEPEQTYTVARLAGLTGFEYTTVAQSLKRLASEGQVTRLGRLPRENGAKGMTPVGWQRVTA